MATDNCAGAVENVLSVPSHTHPDLDHQRACPLCNQGKTVPELNCASAGEEVNRMKTGGSMKRPQDLICTSGHCKNAETYTVDCHCYNCGWKGTAITTKGHEFTMARTCPNRRCKAGLSLSQGAVK